MSSPTRPFDVILWGSLGFTGKFVARYFAETVSRRLPSLRWALVGRDRARLEELSAALAASCNGVAPPILVACATNQAEVDQAVAQAHVVLSTAGPYARIGTPIVDACVRLGSHYVDINGEVGWHRGIIDRFDAAARANGVILVPSCGFDSIPSDLGCEWMAGLLAEKFGVPARRVSCYVTLRGNFSGGTVASGILSDESHGERLADPFLLGGARAGGARPEDADPSGAAFDEMAGAWTAPFGMATINTRIVRRSVGLLEAAAPSLAARLYRPDFSYNERALAPAEAVAVKMARGAAAPAAKRKQLVDAGRLPKPGDGPTAEQRAAAWFKFVMVAEGADASQRVVGSISGGDPGYDETAKMASEAAVLLATTRAAGLPSAAQPAGFLTPATAFGERLRERLHREGIGFEVLDRMPSMGGASKL